MSQIKINPEKSKNRFHFFYIIVLILTLASSLLGAISGKYIALNLDFSSTFFIWSSLLILSFVYRFFSWIILHRKFQLSFIYPFLSLNYIFSLFLGRLLFDEPFNIKKIIGTVIIISGVLLVTFSKDRIESN